MSYFPVPALKLIMIYSVSFLNFRSKKNRTVQQIIFFKIALIHKSHPDNYNQFSCNFHFLIFKAGLQIKLNVMNTEGKL